MDVANALSFVAAFYRKAGVMFPPPDTFLQGENVMVL